MSELAELRQQVQAMHEEAGQMLLYAQTRNEVTAASARISALEDVLALAGWGRVVTAPVPERFVFLGSDALRADVHREGDPEPDLTYPGMARTVLAPVLTDLREQVQARMDAALTPPDLSLNSDYNHGQIVAFQQVLALLDKAE